MSNENQNGQEQKKILDPEQAERAAEYNAARAAVTNYLNTVIPNKGDHLEFGSSINIHIPDLMKDKGSGDDEMTIQEIMSLGDDASFKFKVRDQRNHVTHPVNCLATPVINSVLEKAQAEGMKAVNRYKDGIATRNAIVERVTTPTARHFTHDQADTIRRYLGSFDDPQERDARASYVWNEAKDAGNFQKYPEKWEKDALKEFNDIKNGLTNGQEENRHAHVRL